MKNANDPRVDPDRALVLACQEASSQGHVPPFAELCERHYARVFRQCLCLLGHESDARDACQDTFHCVLRRLPTFQHRSRFTAWLGNVTFNCCRELRRSRHRRMRCWGLVDDASATTRAGSAEESPAARITRYEFEALVGEAIAHLTPILRSVIVSRYFAERSYEDIAASLEISEGTVKSRLFRAHESLKDELARRLAPDELPAGCRCGVREGGRALRARAIE